MILPGFPRMMPAQNKKAPFLLSGGFEGTSDGFVLTQFTVSTSGPRTGSYCILQNANVSAYADLIIPANIAGGMAITVSVYAQRRGASGNAQVQRTIGAGFPLTIGGVTSSSWTLINGSFDNEGEDDIKISLVGAGSFAQTAFDDWVISGVPL